VEVVPPIIAVVELTRLSSEDEKVGQLMEELELGVSEALGMSLSKLRAWYFQDSDKGGYSEVGRDLVDECNYGNVIVNHIKLSWYHTKYIDGMPCVI
jgi:hypothetical protein